MPEPGNTQAGTVQAAVVRHPDEPARFVFRGGAAAADACGAAFGVALPRDACRAAVAGTRAALWLGPDEWLLLLPAAEAAAARPAIAAALGSVPHSLVEVSHRQVAVIVSGAGAATALETGCPLDLAASAFAVGTCTRTLFGKVEIVLWRRAGDEFWIDVARSLAPYLQRLLEHAINE